MGTLFNIGDKIIGDGLSYIFNKTAPIAGYSLQNLKFGYTEPVVEVRRSSDNAAQDFTSNELTDGTLKDFIETKIAAADYGSGAAAAYSLRYVSANYTGPVVNVRRSSDNTNLDFTPEEITDGTLLNWVNEEFVTYQSDFTSGNENLNEINGTGTDGETIAGVSDAYKFTVGTDIARTETRINNLVPVGQTFTISFDYYIPSTNVNLNSISLAFPIASPNLTTKDSWQSVSYTSVTNNDNFRIYVNDGDTDFQGNGTDVFYLKNIVVTQTTADGNVTVWYDQSGNNRNATNSTDTEQPKIVDAGVLVEENGKPAILPDGEGDIFNIGSTQIKSLFIVAEPDESSNGIVGAENGYISTITDKFAYRIVKFIPHRFPARIEQSLWSSFAVGDSNPRDVFAYRNSVASVDNPIARNLILDTNHLFNRGTSSGYYSKKVQEIIIYNTDQSANRTNIEENINDYYNIYTSTFTPTTNGFVSKWYDQSGNGYHATNSTDTEQPKIWDASTGLVTDNGFSCLKFDGTDDNLSATLPAITGNMLLAGTEGSDIFGVDISGGSYSLLANASLTDYPINSVAQVIWDRTLTKEEKDFVKNRLDSKSYSEISFDGVTSFDQYWRSRSELTEFPLIDTSSGTTFNNAWRNCSSLTTFPLLDVSSGSDFNAAWRNCSSLTTFPLLNLSSGTTFGNTWLDCSSLTDFPANRFDSVTATDFTNAFANTNLSSQSIENIVVSVNTANQNNGTLTITGGGNATTETAKTAIINLASRSWAVKVPDGYVSPYLIDAYQGAEAAYSLRQLSLNTTNVVKVRRTSDQTDQNFTSNELTDGTLEDFIKVRNELPANYGSGAAAAYSLRYVSDNYTGPVVNVRRSSDNTNRDFTPDEITDGTLLAWVGTTLSDDGHVTTWYDQSGNNRNATNSTDTEQPKIVDAGELVEENGKVALDFDGVDDGLDANGFNQGLNDFATFVILNISETNDWCAVANGSSRVNEGGFMIAGESNDRYRTLFWTNTASQVVSTSSVTKSGQVLQSIIGDRDNLLSQYLNGIFGSSTNISSFSNVNLVNNGDLTIGYGFSFQNRYCNTPIQEIIIYDSDQSANRKNIEANINDYYNIYTPTVEGFVSKWYDQSGNGNHATNSTDTEQPKIWDASTGLVTENGKSAVDFDGIDDKLSLDGYSIVTTLNEVASFVVFKQNSTGQTSGVLSLGSSSDDTRFYVPRLTSAIRLGYGDDQSLINSGIDDTNQHLVSAYTDSTRIYFKVDDLFTGSSPIQNVTITYFTNQEIGKISNEFDGKVQEIIIYNTDQSANRGNIENNINNYYNIYS